MDRGDIEARYPLLLEGENVGSMPALAAGAQTPLPADILARAQGCLLGQLAGDSLGSLVEFRSRAFIHADYPGGIRYLADGGTHDTIAGQPTDDSEMALMLARSIVRAGTFDADETAVAYAYWFDSRPFDYGSATASALGPAAAGLNRGDSPAAIAEAARAYAKQQTQANGALMRVSPMGIFAHAFPASAGADLARQDAALTHPHQICQDASAALVVAIAHAVATGSDPEQIYAFTVAWATGAIAQAAPAHPAIRECLDSASVRPPQDYETHQGWVLIALGNAFWQLLHAPSLEEGVSDTVMHAGDTDTNAAIAGALLGAVHGAVAIPAQWRKAILSCRPEGGRSGVRRPRPKPFWPVDALALAEAVGSIGLSCCDQCDTR